VPSHQFAIRPGPGLPQRRHPVERIASAAIKRLDEKHIVDIIVHATGFDATQEPFGHIYIIGSGDKNVKAR